ncbi:MAG: MFS transporter [Candidatus Hydrogenedentota bacterium]
MSASLTPLSPEQRMWRWKVLISTYFAYAGFYLVRKVFTICKSTLAKPIEEGGFGMGFDQVANIWTAYLVAYMLGQFVNSFIGRKYGPRVLLLGGLGLSIVCNVIFGFANSYHTFFLFMFFNGIVQAAGWPGCVGSVAQWLRKNDRGTIMGIWSTNYQIGNIAVKMIGGFLLGHYSTVYSGVYGVRYAFWGCTVMAFAVWWLVYFWQRTSPKDVGLDAIVHNEAHADKSVEATDAESVTFSEFLKLFLNPVVPMMGLGYFCIKFLRYALDSWLPTFLDLQGMNVDSAAYYSSIFDWTGFVGAIVTGVALDRMFRGRWDRVCLVLGVGLVFGYVAVTRFGGNPYTLSFLFGFVGFMLYGIDTLLNGAAAVVVAGERNAVAVTGLINGIGSIGPIVQEQVIGRLISGEAPADAIHNSNLLGLSMSITYLLLMALIVVQTSRRHRRYASRLQGAA